MAHDEGVMLGEIQTEEQYICFVYRIHILNSDGKDAVFVSTDDEVFVLVLPMLCYESIIRELWI